MCNPYIMKLIKLHTLALFVALFSSSAAWSLDDQLDSSCHLDLTKSKYMRVVRIDRHAPCGCKPFRVEQFTEEEVDYFVEGIQSTKGADHKMDLTRSEAKLLWEAYNPKKSDSYRASKRHQISRNPKLQNYLELVDRHKDSHGFEFKVEGEILEAVTIMTMERDTYPQEDYFITGGITYFGRSGSQTLGELDIVVFDRDTCKVVSIGEAKLTKSSSKARRQLARFRQFIEDFMN